jgi:hypothetical protein
MKNSLPKNNVGKKALSLGVTFFILVISSYVWNFYGSPISGDPSHWGVLGDFVGGVINPLLGLVTIWLLTMSLRQSNEMLDQARAELKATLEELKRGQEIQRATENALKKQISLAENARDLEGAIRLITYWQSRHDILVQAGNDEVEHARIMNRSTDYIEQIRNQYSQLALNTLKKTEDFDHIIGQEANRLLTRFPKPEK